MLLNHRVALNSVVYRIYCGVLFEVRTVKKSVLGHFYGCFSWQSVKEQECKLCRHMHFTNRLSSCEEIPLVCTWKTDVSYESCSCWRRLCLYNILLPLTHTHTHTHTTHTHTPHTHPHTTHTHHTHAHTHTHHSKQPITSVSLVFDWKVTQLSCWTIIIGIL